MQARSDGRRKKQMLIDQLTLYFTMYGIEIMSSVKKHETEIQAIQRLESQDDGKVRQKKTNQMLID